MTYRMNRELPADDFDQPSHLSRAIRIWRQGGRISMTTAAALMADGYDVPSLERAYSRGGR